MYTLYKIKDGDKTVIAYCDSPTDGAQAIEADIRTFKDNASYELIREGTNESIA